ncbi:hypothetical protein [Mesonia sp.]|uniref:hypothetical protein n=1 Tax=Mesonia sp. TaxID=1960830 RepID=UPI00176DD70F|nr:hypothetical protein [Mesonia sp.]HIB37971.1 hypothetical protein [Mesonia sp.]HIO26605.1 hypothetical protein [Flavobacteriaceae bacterium]
MFKLILNLLWNRAKKNQWQLQIGAYLLKKGCGYEIGQIVQEKRLERGKWRVKVITGIFYNFNTNEINHTAENRVITTEAKKRITSQKVLEEKKLEKYFRTK